MIPKIKLVKPLDNYILYVVFDDNKEIYYDTKEDMHLPGYNNLQTVNGLFQQVQLDQSRTCVFWNDMIDIPSDILYEYGKSTKDKL